MVYQVGNISIFDLVTYKLLVVVHDRSVCYAESSHDIVLYKLPYVVLHDVIGGDCYYPFGEVVGADYGKVIYFQ